jgi:hypothetical protein
MKDLKIEDLKVGDCIKNKNDYTKLEILWISDNNDSIEALDHGYIIKAAQMNQYELWDYVQDEKKKHNDHYKAQGIDTFTRAKANMSKEHYISCLKFNIDKYNWRDKGQDQQDIDKIRVYLDEWENALKDG